MKIIDLLNKIENEEMQEAIFYVNGYFFYDLIVIDKELYVINTITKKLEPLENKYISRFINDNVELIRLDKFEEILEEEKKIPEKIEYYDDSIAWVIDDVGQLSDVDKVIIDTLNGVIDYIKSKGDE